MTALDPTADLETRLAAATRCDTAPGAWRAALAAERPGSFRARFSRPLPGTLVGVAAVLVLCVAIVAVALPSLGKARSVAHRLPAPAASPLEAEKSLEFAAGTPGVPDGGAMTLGTLRADVDDQAPANMSRRVPPGGSGGLAATPAPAPRPNAPLERHVVRKASIELRTPDVRALAARAQLIVNDAAGEFVEESSLSGESDAAWAQLTLRVAASRLSEVLSQLRALGKVVSESAGGQDVTDQVVDLEARLRNEQQVERELLHLLTTRDSAPLKEILELRDHISSVREQIERLTAQRDKLSRLTSLATVLVIVRHDGAPEAAEQESGWWLQLRERISNAAASGLRALADAVAFLVWAFIGGLIWWVLLGVAIFTILRLHRASLRRRAAEPPPAL